MRRFRYARLAAISLMSVSAHAECVGSPGSGGRGCQDSAPQAEACALPEHAAVSQCALQRLAEADRTTCLSRQAQARPAYRDVVLSRCVNNFTNSYAVKKGFE